MALEPSGNISRRVRTNILASRKMQHYISGFLDAVRLWRSTQQIRWARFGTDVHLPASARRRPAGARPRRRGNRIECNLLQCICRLVAERPEGADYQWRKIPLGELSIDPVADERLVRVTARAGASSQRLPWAAERSGGP